MTVSGFHPGLVTLLGIRETRSVFRIFCNDMLGRDIPVSAPGSLSGGDLMLWQEVERRLLQHEPIQYIVNKAWFYGFNFYVNGNVLIPRPETEELVDLILRENSHRKSPKILDIGTGSGCIAVSLAGKINGSQVTAMDISEKVLKVADKNARANGVKIEWWHGDILDINPGDISTKWDIIVSNPPYIAPSESAKMSASTLQYEPHLALFSSDDDPLVFYRKIMEFAVKCLSENGILYFELNEYNAEETLALAGELGFKGALIPDLQQKLRFARLTYK